MPQSWTKKQERQYEHIKASASKRGRSTKRAKQIAAATVNKQRSSRSGKKRSTSRRKTRSRSGGRSRSR